MATTSDVSVVKKGKHRKEKTETDRLLKTLSRYFYIPGYSADVVDFPSSNSDDGSSSESETENQASGEIDSGKSPESESENQTESLCKKLDQFFHIPGYSADVVDFPSSSSDDDSSGEPVKKKMAVPGTSSDDFQTAEKEESQYTHPHREGVAQEHTGGATSQALSQQYSPLANKEMLDQEQSLPAMQPIPGSKSFEVPVLPEGFKYHFYVSSTDETLQLERHLQSQLSSRKFICFRKEDEPGQSEFDGLDECYKKIAIINPTYLDDKIKEFEFLSSKTDSIQNKTISPPILILHNIDPSDVPPYIREVNYLQTRDQDFWDKLIRALTSEPKPMSALPAGDIAEGLAWQYFYNYLTLLLPGFHERALESEFNKEEGIPLLAKLMILLPRSCINHSNLSEVDENVTQGANQCLKWKQMFAGTERVYDVQVWTVLDPDNSSVKYYVPMEIAAPLVTMRDMELGQISGLGQQEKEIQTQKFKEVLETIFQRADLHKDAVLLEYDDRSEDPHELSRKVIAKVNEEFSITPMEH